MNRRSFLSTAGKAGVAWSLGGVPLGELVAKDELIKLTILHTNDVHSRIHPFPKSKSGLSGKGGAARRAALIRRIRQEDKHVLLFDSGDIFQGTPYFNEFGGELEFKLMSKMGYDAATLGNHDFDAGLEGLKKQLPHASFPFISSNYDFSDTLLYRDTQPWKIFRKGPLKIGVLGVGIELEGLVDAPLYGNTRYLNPISHANKVSKFLKEDKKCDVVVCLSHLGFKYTSSKVSDVILAENSENIDIILGGHTHTFMKVPLEVTGLSGQKVSINQVGWGGVILGRYDLYFKPGKRKYRTDSQALFIQEEKSRKTALNN